ncbi:hypothetical protein LXL04_017313 [Taraxacum kok-saghyz]
MRSAFGLPNQERRYLPISLFAVFCQNWPPALAIIACDESRHPLTTNTCRHLIPTGIQPTILPPPSTSSNTDAPPAHTRERERPDSEPVTTSSTGFISFTLVFIIVVIGSPTGAGGTTPGGQRELERVAWSYVCSEQKDDGRRRRPASYHLHHPIFCRSSSSYRGCGVPEELRGDGVCVQTRGATPVRSSGDGRKNPTVCSRFPARRIVWVNSCGTSSVASSETQTAVRCRSFGYRWWQGLAVHTGVML